MENLPSFTIDSLPVCIYTPELPVLAVLGQLPQEGAEGLGTYLVFFQEQPGNVDVPVLDRIRKGSDPTPVSAVRFVRTPGKEDKTQDRAVGSSKIFPLLLWG